MPRSGYFLTSFASTAAMAGGLTSRAPAAVARANFCVVWGFAPGCFAIQDMTALEVWFAISPLPVEPYSVKDWHAVLVALNGYPPVVALGWTEHVRHDEAAHRMLRFNVLRYSTCASSERSGLPWCRSQSRYGPGTPRARS